MQKVLVVHDFMLNDRKLKGSRLLVFALLYSYSQIPNSSFTCSYETASKFLGISKSSYFDALSWLIDNNYIDSQFKPYKNDRCFSLNNMHNTYFEKQVKIAQYKWVK